MEIIEGKELRIKYNYTEFDFRDKEHGGYKENHVMRLNGVEVFKVNNFKYIYGLFYRRDVALVKISKNEI